MATLTINGQTVQATALPIQSSHEAWSEHLLADGTVLRAKHVAVAAYRLEGAVGDDGQPVYVLQERGIVVVANAKEA